MAKVKQTKADRNLKRVFLITKIIFCVLPFMALSYLYLTADSVGLDYQEALNSDPALAVSFLSAMIQPFAAWLLTLVEKRVNNYDYSNALSLLILIFIAECLLRNYLGIAGTAVLFYMINKGMPFSFKEEFKKYANWKKILVDGSGGFVLILFSAICFFASLKIGGV